MNVQSASETVDKAKDAFQKEMPRMRRLANVWNKFAAIIISVNFILVLFNATYVPLRDVYWRYFPAIVTTYDPVKNIEPHPDTQRYLNTVGQLEQQLASAGLESEQTEQLLVELKRQSRTLIEENPFLAANKFGTFETLKRRIRRQVGADSAQEAFSTFWSQQYLEQNGWNTSLQFFEARLAPLLESNYTRTIGVNGQFADDFWRIDAYFVALFAIEFLIRTFWMSYRKPELNWLDAMLRRWYDILLLIPVWRWLRFIPASVRLHRSKVLNMERALSQVTHEPAAYLADRVSTFLLVRLINQTKEAVEHGEVAQMLFEPQSYIQVSDVNKVDAISDRLLNLTIYRALPEIQPDLEELLRHSLREALKDSDVFRGVQRFPGLQNLPAEVTQNLADYLARASYEILEASYSDEEGRKIVDRLSQNFKDALANEIRNQTTQLELQTLIADLLEEIKLNYVQRSAQHNPEEILSEADQLYQAAERSEVEELINEMGGDRFRYQPKLPPKTSSGRNSETHLESNSEEK
ncbi:MAG: hypothetical protein ACFE0J_19950 [Elainellaceae cyanobacterium]